MVFDFLTVRALQLKRLELCTGTSTNCGVESAIFHVFRTGGLDHILYRPEVENLLILVSPCASSFTFGFVCATKLFGEPTLLPKLPNLEKGRGP